MCHLSKLPNRLFSESYSDFTKQGFAIGKHKLEFVYEDKEPKLFLWHTSAQNIKKAIRQGILSYDALTTKAISSLGKYHHSVNHRAYMHGIISDKHSLKQALLLLSQSNIEALQPLERLINSPFNDNLKADKIIDTIEQYQNQVLKNYQEIELLNPHFRNYDRNIQQQWQKQKSLVLKQSQLLIEKFKNCCNHQNINRLCQAITPDGIFSFIKQQSIEQIRFCQENNQNIIYSGKTRSWLRGDLHSVCEDALKEINDYALDYHNPILAAHQGNFSETHAPLIVNFDKQNPTEVQNCLMAICQIEGLDRITLDEDQKYTLEKVSGYKYSLQQTPYTKWTQQGSTKFLFARFSCWLWNIIIGLSLGLTFDLVAGLLSGLSGRKLEAIANKAQLKIKAQATKNTYFDLYLSKFQLKKYSLGTLIGFKLVNFCRNICVDLYRGAATTAQQYKIELWDNLYTDYQFGHGKTYSSFETIQKINSHILKLEKQYQQVIKHINQQAPTPYKNFKFSKHQKTIALQPFLLSNGEWLDLSNSAIHGLKTIADTFTHTIHNKNPFLGLLFCSTYALTGLSILNPSAVSFLPSSFIHFSNTLKDALSKGHITGAMGASSMQSQVVTASIEACLNGNASWLASGGKMFENDPSNILVYTTLAISLGALIAFKLNIPMISQKIREDLGNIPLPSLGFAGAKLGILLIHLLEEREKPITVKEQQNYKLKIKTILTEAHQQHNIKQQSSKQLDQLIDQLITAPTLFAEHSPLAKNTNIEALYFLSFLENKKYFLPYLPSKDKREIQHQAKQLFPNQIAVHKSINSLLNPPTHQSIFIISILTPLNYIPLLIRCLTTPITLCPAPFFDLQDKIHKDLTRIYNAAANGVYVCSSVIKIFLKCIYEIVFNETAARLESTLTEDSHIISNGSYQKLRALDNHFEHCKSHLSHDLNQHKSYCNYVDPLVLFKHSHQLAKTSTAQQPIPQSTSPLVL